MANNEIAHDRFGCDHCWPVEAEAAWSVRLGLVRLLIDESHFRVLILNCELCGQLFISVFAEWIDWKNGNDPQYWIRLPITDAESANLLQKPDSISENEIEDEINGLGKERASLRRDFPSDAKSPYVYWGRGIHVPPHD